MRSGAANENLVSNVPKFTLSLNPIISVMLVIDEISCQDNLRFKLITLLYIINFFFFLHKLVFVHHLTFFLAQFRIFPII